MNRQAPLKAKRTIFNQKRVGLLVGLVLSLVTMLFSQTNLQDLISTNMTARRIEEVTRMPILVLIGLVILLITILVYLWVDAGKDEDTNKLIKDKASELSQKLDSLTDEIKGLRQDLKDRGGKDGKPKLNSE